MRNFRVFSSWILGASVLLAMLPLRGAEARGGQSTLVLGVQHGGSLNAQARQAIMNHLVRQGEAVVQARLGRGDLGCTQVDCLMGLTRREQAAAVLWGNIEQSDRNYEIRLWLFVQRTQQTESKVEHCQNCTEAQMLERVADAAGELVSAASVTCPPCPRCTEAASPQPALNCPQIPGVESRPVSIYWTNWRRGLTGIFGGLLGASLMPTVTLHALDGLGSCRDFGAYPHGLPCTDRYNNKLLYTAGYVTVGAALVGLIVTLAVPAKKGASR